jgi:magnesium transporter
MAQTDGPASQLPRLWARLIRCAPMSTAPTPPASERLRLRQGTKAGLSPGSLVHIGKRRLDGPRITVFEYDADTLHERVVASLKDEGPQCRKEQSKDTVIWVDVDGISEADCITDLGQRFGLHQLVLEDVMNAGQRVKLEDYNDCLFVVLKMLDVNDDEEVLFVEQLSLVLGKNFVITFQEQTGDVFDGVRDRIKSNKGRIRRMGADYLLYALLDAVVDKYAVVLDSMSEIVESLEEKLQVKPQSVSVNDIYVLKREVQFLRRQIAPAPNVFSDLVHQEPGLLSSSVDVYLRDVFDHSTRAAQNVEALHDMTQAMVEMYHSNQSARLNEVMRLLTVISTIFMPLTFIVGVYGMNFDNMPELRMHNGYYVCLAVMAVVAVGMTIYMKRNRWL